MGLEVGGRFEREGTYVYLWLICVNVWRKATQFCKEIVLQLKNKFKQRQKNRAITLAINREANHKSTGLG